MANKPEAKTLQNKASFLPLTEKQIGALIITAINQYWHLPSGSMD